MKRYFKNGTMDILFDGVESIYSPNGESEENILKINDFIIFCQ